MEPESSLPYSQVPATYENNTFKLHDLCSLKNKKIFSKHDE
jgi:hypothetical protein